MIGRYLRSLTISFCKNTVIFVNQIQLSSSPLSRTYVGRLLKKLIFECNLDIFLLHNFSPSFQSFYSIIINLLKSTKSILI